MSISSPATEQPPKKGSSRVVSIDAFRGFVMLAMVSGGFAFARSIESHPEILAQYDGTAYAEAWKTLWRTLAYQFSHVEWTGCALWDLIQPSFMFLVGVSMPFSFAKRRRQGQSRLRWAGHVLGRSLILVLLGVFLKSNWSSQTNFSFVNVLTQIGLGYAFVALLLNRHRALQLLAVAGILGGYWYYFYQYEIPQSEYENVTRYLQEVKGKDASEWTQFESGIATHWNKHVNAAAAFDRWFLNLFPRHGQEWNGQKFWVNDGGYQTLNFIPSIATMLFGLMAGQLLMSHRTQQSKFRRLVGGGLLCMLVAMSVDTTIWPVEVPGCDWSLCPVVKRIWTPSWAVFSAGWTLWMLAAFYAVIERARLRRWAFPLTVVGLNPITMYCMAQLIKPWVSKTLEIHLTAADAAFGTRAVYHFFSGEYAYAAILESLARLAVLWLICLWLYRRRIFVRI